MKPEHVELQMRIPLCLSSMRLHDPHTVGWYGYRHMAASPHGVPNRPQFPLRKYVHTTCGFLLFSYGTLMSIYLYSVCGFSHIIMYIRRNEREAKVPTVLLPLTRYARYATCVYTVLSHLTRYASAKQTLHSQYLCKSSIFMLTIFLSVAFWYF